MPEIFILTGPDIGRSFEVSDGAAFGRSPDCSVRLRDRSISRQHAHLTLVDGCWILSDDGSRNGVFAGTKPGSERVERFELVDGSEFRLGDVACRFRNAPAASQSAPVAGSEVEVEVEVELELGDEIELDAGEQQALSEEPEFVVGGGAGRVERPAARALAAPAGEPVAGAASDSPEPARRPARGPDRRSARSSATASPRVPSGRLLQYHKVEQRSGFLSADLSQYPVALRVLAYLLLGALAAGLAWLAFRATAAL